MRFLLAALCLLSVALVVRAGVPTAADPDRGLGLALAWGAVYLVLALLALIWPTLVGFLAAAAFNGLVGAVLAFLWFVARNFTNSPGSFGRSIVWFIALQFATAIVAVIAAARLRDQPDLGLKG